MSKKIISVELLIPEKLVANKTPEQIQKNFNGQLRLFLPEIEVKKVEIK